MVVRIGEVAAQAGVTTKALRYYERVGLLPPAERTGSGYRDYPDSVRDRLRFIRAAQAVGLTLAEIRGVIGLREQGNPPCAHVLELVESRADDLQRRIDEFSQLRDELRELAKRGRYLSPDACSSDLVCHILNPAPARAGPCVEW